MNKRAIQGLLLITAAIVGYLVYDRVNQPTADDLAVDPMAAARKATDAKVSEFYRVFSDSTLTNPDAKLRRLATASQLADEILALENVDERERNSIELSALDLKGEHAVSAFAYQSPNAPELETAWIDFAHRTMKSPTEVNASRAHSNLCAYYIMRYAKDPSELILTQLQEQTRSSLPMLLEKQHDLTRMSNRIESLGSKIESERDTIPGFLVEAGNIFKGTGKQSDWLFGSAIHDQLVLRGRDMETVCTKVEFNLPSAIETMQSFMLEVTEADIPSERLYALVFSGLEAFKRLDEDADFSQAITKIENSIQQIESPTIREKTSQQLANYRKRTSGMIGQKIDLTFVDSDKNFNSNGKKFSENIAGKEVVIFFANNSERTRNFGQNLVSFRGRKADNKDEEYIYVGTPMAEYYKGVAPTKAVDPKSFQRILQSSLGNTHVFLNENAKKLISQIPIEDAPFLVVLDGQHRVVKTNAHPALLGRHLSD